MISTNANFDLNNLEINYVKKSNISNTPVCEHGWGVGIGGGR